MIEFGSMILASLRSYLKKAVWLMRQTAQNVRI